MIDSFCHGIFVLFNPFKLRKYQSSLSSNYVEVSVTTENEQNKNVKTVCICNKSLFQTNLVNTCFIM